MYRCRRFFTFQSARAFIQPLAVQEEIADGGDILLARGSGAWTVDVYIG